MMMMKMHSKMMTVSCTATYARKKCIFWNKHTVSPYQRTSVLGSAFKIGFQLLHPYFSPHHIRGAQHSFGKQIPTWRWLWLLLWPNKSHHTSILWGFGTPLQHNIKYLPTFPIQFWIYESAAGYLFSFHIGIWYITFTCLAQGILV